ncbi:MAG: thioredoxin [Aliihoeflea sp.]
MHRDPVRPAFAASMEGGAGLVGGSVAPAEGLIKDTTTASFSADVVQESRKQPVLVDFWAPWCGPCKQLQPALEKVVKASKGRVKLVKMNIDEHPSIAGQLGIQSIPAVIAFKDGQPVDGFMGAVPESKIVEFIDKVAGPGGAGAAIEDALAAAADARKSGDLQGAVGIYSAVLAEEPGHPQASAALATLLLDAGQKDDALSVIEQVPADKAGHADMLAVKARLDLDSQAAGLGDPAALEQRLAADPADHEARFDLALIQNARGDRAAAVDSLLAIVKADREWREDGARAQLLKFFEAWGMTDPATLAARRKLSSVLFS